MRDHKLRSSVNWLEALKQRHKTSRCKMMIGCNYNFSLSGLWHSVVLYVVTNILYMHNISIFNVDLLTLPSSKMLVTIHLTTQCHNTHHHIPKIRNSLNHSQTIMFCINSVKFCLTVHIKHHIYPHIKWQSFPHSSSEKWASCHTNTCKIKRSVCVFSWKLKTVKVDHLMFE